MNQRKPIQKRTLDIICLGRAAVDFYGDQIGSSLQDMSSFSKYLGGSSANIALGTARLGLKSAMLTRVGNEHMGEFIREELARAGVDNSNVATDPNRLTGLVVLGIKDNETFPLIFYRQDCADMAISEEDIDPDFIASSKSLLITGTHFSTTGTYSASKKAIQYAKAAGTKVIIDIDYRPVLWGLTSLGDGETRFISSQNVSSHFQTILPDCDLIVGTEEEIHIGGGSTDTITALRKIRELSTATIVLKLGPLGCTVLDGAIPHSMQDIIAFQGVTVDVLNVLGAGDAFISGFLRGWLQDKDYKTCASFANACGALVVSRHGCAPAIPSIEELDYYLANSDTIARPDLDEELNYLHRVTTRPAKSSNEIYGLAFDHRKQFFDMAIEEDADPQRIHQLKSLLVSAAIQGANTAHSQSNIAVLIDDTYGQHALNQITGKDWWIGRPVEEPSSRPLEFEGGLSIGDKLRSWPREHIVKCLVFYHPNDLPAILCAQQQKIVELYRACCQSGHQLLLELIPPENMEINDRTIPDAMEQIYNLGVRPDWWKLPGLNRETWQIVTDIIEHRSPHCNGVVMLGLDAPKDEIQQSFKIAKSFPICKGFTIGRTIFSTPSRQWLRQEINDQQLIDAVAANYVELIGSWRDSD
ncbi:5-dehydro-2-deoxygluconokinase [Gammaproteobacteria bacterium AS21]